MNDQLLIIGDIYVDCEMFVVLLTNVQHVIPTVTRKDATNEVLANVTKAARAVTFCHESTSAWVCRHIFFFGAVCNAEMG